MLTTKKQLEQNIKISKAWKMSVDLIADQDYEISKAVKCSSWMFALSKEEQDALEHIVCMCYNTQE